MYHLKNINKSQPNDTEEVADRPTHTRTHTSQKSPCACASLHGLLLLLVVVVVVVVIVVGGRGSSSSNSFFVFKCMCVCLFFLCILCIVQEVRLLRVGGIPGLRWQHIVLFLFRRSFQPPKPTDVCPNHRASSISFRFYYFLSLPAKTLLYVNLHVVRVCVCVYDFEGESSQHFHRKKM